MTWCGRKRYASSESIHAEGSTPLGEEQTTEQEQVVVGDVVGMMRSFQRMSEALINHLDRDEGRESVPNEGSQCTPVGSSSIHRELEKVKFPSFGVPQMA
jgi:hypothetical protein